MDASRRHRIRRRSGLRLGLVPVLLVMALAAGCGTPLVRPRSTPRPTPSPSPTFEAERTGFDGIVVDEDGEPIADVRIVLRIGARRGTAFTTAEGTFFDRGNLGEIRLTATLEGYEEAEASVIVMPDEIAEVEIVLVAED